MPLRPALIRRTGHHPWMIFATQPVWLTEFITSAQAESAGFKTSFYRAVHAGAYRRIVPGRYLPTETWSKLTADDRYLAIIYALGVGRPEVAVYSHLSAAALWRLPMVGQWPPHADILLPEAGGGRSRVGALAHSDRIPLETSSIDGRSVTNLARTVVDVARTQPLSMAVAMADFAMRVPSARDVGLLTVRTTPEELAEELASHPSARGRKKAGLALSIANGLSGSPGESLSRVGMHVLGIRAPVLQHEFVDDLGPMFVDFWWPEYNLIGEFDGYGKYLREELRNGRSIADTIIREKTREDRLRALGPRVGRWNWTVARSLPLLEAKMRSLGLF